MAKELVKQENTSLTERPNYIKQGDTRGTDHITKDDLQMPRLALAQALSPQMQEGDAKFIEGLKVGDLFNNLTGDVFGKGPIDFTVVRADSPRGIEFYPLDEGGGIKDFSVPLDDHRMEFRTDENGKSIKPAATKFYDYVIMLVPSRELIALSFKGTGLKVARQLNALMKLRGTPSFAGKYSLTTGKETNKLGTFAVHQVKNAGWVTEDEFKWAEGVYESIKDKTLVIERDQEEEPSEEKTPF